MVEVAHWDSIERERQIPFGRVKIASGRWNGNIDQAVTMPIHHLELSLIQPKGAARGCLVDVWGPRQFQRCGSMFFLLADEPIHFRSNVREQKSVICEFNPSALNEWLEREVLLRAFVRKNPFDLSNHRIRTLLLALMDELVSPGFAGQVMVDSLTSQLAIELLRFMKAWDENEPSDRGGLAPWRQRIIDERLAELVSQPSLSELADLCNLSVRQLTRAFRASHGQSVGAYVAERRADHAKRLIASGMSIKAVAYTMGFSAPSNFSAAFTRATGETPRDHQRRVNRNCSVGKTRRG